MNDKKHIDRLFQEKFKNFEATPDDAVWDNIHRALHKDKRKRRVIPFWWKTAGVAAILALLFTVGNFVFTNDDGFSNPETEVVGNDTTQSSSDPVKTFTNKEKNKSTTIENSNTIANTDQSRADSDSDNDIHNKTVSTRGKSATHVANDESERRNTTTSHSQNEKVNTSKKDKMDLFNSKEEAVAKNTSNLPQPNFYKEVNGQGNDRIKTSLEKENMKIAEVVGQNKIKETETLTPDEEIASSNKEESIEEAIAKANTIDIIDEKEEQPNRWNITPNVAPVYFNTLGKGSTIHSQFVNNNKSGEVNMSYGISGSYAINNRIKVRAGINKVDLGYSTKGIIAFNDINSFSRPSANAELQNINYKNRSSTYAYLSTSSINVASAPQFLVSKANGALEQQFGYIEVPLELEYTIINNTFGLNVIGGFSTLFLNNNQIFSVLENERSLMGEANNINSTSYSANFGLGLNYNISNTLKLNLEPMFKYQINTFTNTSGDFRPYFIGVYTGFSFKF